jgi:hypothetical protein
VNTSWQTALPETPPVHAKPPPRPAFVTTHWSGEFQRAEQGEIGHPPVARVKIEIIGIPLHEHAQRTVA